MQITWLGHGTVELRLGKQVIVIDPWLENPRFPAGYEFQKCDTILVTHGHFDHITGVLPLASRFDSQVISNFEIASWLQSKGAKNPTAMNKGGTVMAGSAKVTMTHAIHSSTIVDGDRIIPAGEACGFVIEFEPGRRLYFAGDTAVHSDMNLIRELYTPELTFLPIGDLFTMGPEQAALATKMIGAKTVIPVHYGTFPQLPGTPSALQRMVDPLGVNVQELTPGEPWTY